MLDRYLKPKGKIWITKILESFPEKNSKKKASRVQFTLSAMSMQSNCGVLWTSGTMNSGHVTKRVRVHVCASGSSKGDFMLLELLTLVASRNTTLATRMVEIRVRGIYHRWT